jgi:hypothetical protein
VSKQFISDISVSDRSIDAYAQANRVHSSRVPSVASSDCGATAKKAPNNSAPAAPDTTIYPKERTNERECKQHKSTAQRAVVDKRETSESKEIRTREYRRTIQIGKSHSSATTNFDETKRSSNRDRKQQVTKQTTNTASASDEAGQRSTHRHALV